MFEPLKRKIKYIHDGDCYDCLLDFENITSICFGCGSQSHKFDTCMLNSKCISLKLEKFQEISQVDETLGFHMESKTEIQDADWVEVRLKRALDSCESR